MRALRIAFAITLVVPAAAAATLRFVAVWGVDAGPCTDSGAPCRTIQYAVDQSASGDTIRLHQGGLYTETVSITTAFDPLTIEGGWADDFGWRHRDPSATIVDGDDGGPVFEVSLSSGTTDLRIEYLTIRDGSETYGGGVAAHGFSGATVKVTLDHVRLVDNHAGTGGGAAARAIGGSVELDIEHSLIEGNIAGEGGGVAAVADLGGLAQLSLESCLVLRNEAQDWPDSTGLGGAVYATSTRLGDAQVDLVNTVVAQNAAEEGGIYAESGYCDSCGQDATTDVDVLNSTVTENGSTGIAARSWDHGKTTVSLVNAIAWGNSYYDIAATGDWYDTEITAWYADVKRTDIGHDATYSEIGAVVDTDPLFVAPADDDYHLTAVSPLVDAGICGYYVSTFYVRIAPFDDLDGELRPPVGAPWGCDIGADEYRPFERWVAPAGSDVANPCTVAAVPCATVQHAIDEALAGGGRYRHDIHLAVGAYPETLQIVDPLAPVSLQGGWSADFGSRQTAGFDTLVDAGGVGGVLAFEASGGEATLRLESLTLTGGSAADGGGLSFTCTLGFGRLDLQWVILTDNHATGSGGGLRARITACDLEMEIQDTLISDNTAGDGGGGGYIRSDVGSRVATRTRFDTIAGNEAGYAGGLYFLQTGNGKGWLWLDSALLALNRGPGGAPDDLWIHQAGTDFVWVEAEDSDIQTVTQYGGVYLPDPTVISVNPGFADPAAGDYHLTPYSPVLDLGGCYLGSAYDCDGDPRPSSAGCDMGADEYAGGWIPPLDLWITRERLDAVQVREACRSVLAGPEVTVTPGATVELRADRYVAINNGFEVATGATLTLSDYLPPACPPPMP